MPRGQVEIERNIPLQKKNLHDQNMNLGNASGPITTVEPPWLREWISPRPREDDNFSDDSGSDSGPEGLIDSSSEEDFGDAHPQDGIDPSDHEDDD